MKTQNSNLKSLRPRRISLRLKNHNSEINNLVLILITFLLLNYFLHSSAFAASISLTEGTPTTITDFNQEYQVKVNLSIDASDGTIYYLRGVFYKTGTTNYCGYNWNGSSWYNGPYTTNEGWKNLATVTTSSSSAVTSLKVKLDSSDNGCKDSGSYNFKVQRFTQGGSGSFDSQNEQPITVNIPTSTPMPTNTSTPTPNPSNTPIPSNTPGPTTAPTASVVPTKKPTVTIKPREIYEVFDEKDKPTGVVLGESAPSITPTEEVQQTNAPSSKMSLPVLFILIGGGAVCIIAAVLLSIRQAKERKSGLF